jgi:hypothetical protein
LDVLAIMCAQIVSVPTNLDGQFCVSEYEAALLKHFQDQLEDRKIYWALRARAKQDRDVLCVITDGMDKSKFSLPRWSMGRTPKDPVADHVARPQLDVSAVIVHGWGTYIFLSDELLASTASYKIDLVLQALDFAHAHGQKKQFPWPADLSLHADNTVAEIKNSVAGRTLAALACAGFFRCIGHQHLRVGHSHEDVGALGSKNTTPKCGQALVPRNFNLSRVHPNHVC